MAKKTYPITKMIWFGSAITVLSGANMAITGEATVVRWIGLACGIALVIQALIVKKMGFTDA